MSKTESWGSQGISGQFPSSLCTTAQPPLFHGSFGGWWTRGGRQSCAHWYSLGINSSYLRAEGVTLGSWGKPHLKMRQKSRYTTAWDNKRERQKISPLGICGSRMVQKMQIHFQGSFIPTFLPTVQIDSWSFLLLWLQVHRVNHESPNAPSNTASAAAATTEMWGEPWVRVIACGIYLLTTVLNPLL